VAARSWKIAAITMATNSNNTVTSVNRRIGNAMARRG